MDRSTFLGRKQHTLSAPMQKPRPRPQSDLSPYGGPWGREQAAHLLRRTLFGPKAAEIDWATQAGLSATLTQLLAPGTMPAPPVNFQQADDPDAPLGTTWVNAGTYSNFNFYRRRSLVAWNHGLMLDQGISLREKMTLFWHNHFAIELDVVNDARFVYRYNDLLRTNALGNFQTLVEKMTVGPTMLRYLNGNQNIASSPNENYARELFELFTIGKGPLIGPGDYTHYTEDDVRAASEVLTGWRDRGYGNQEGPIRVEFRDTQHDTGTKVFSHAFNQHSIQNLGDLEYKALIQMIFDQAETARFICRKLYRWFVYYEINDTVEQQVIAPMAQLLIASNYEMKPVVEALLGSEHFFDALNIGCLIKNPIDFGIGLMRQLDVQFPDIYNITPRYWHLYFLQVHMGEQLMELFAPPNVAGWPAYYQIPNFHEAWISSVTLPARSRMVSRYVQENGYVTRGYRTFVQPLLLVQQVSDPLNPNVIIDEWSELFFPQSLDPAQKDFLKEVLIPGLPDYEWTLEYGDYLAYPNDDALRESVLAKLKALLETMLNMAEYHLS